METALVTDKIEGLLQQLAGEYPDIFESCSNADEMLNILTSESMLALMFISSIEDEFDIEFDDDEIDMDFFQSTKNIDIKIKKYL